MSHGQFISSTPIYDGCPSAAAQSEMNLPMKTLLLLVDVLQAEVHLSELGILLQRLRGPTKHDTSMFDDVCAMRNVEAALDALLDQQGGHALPVDLFDCRIDVVDDDRREPQRDLIEDDQLRPRH